MRGRVELGKSGLEGALKRTDSAVSCMLVLGELDDAGE